MWGKERGKIPINYRTHFGNVLPDSIRKFEFTWKGEQSITDIGRYKAVASLAYGLDQKQFSTQSTYFWVIPIKSLVITLGSLLLLLLGVLWGIKLYIRHMLKLAGVPTSGFHAEVESRHVHEHEPTEGDIKIASYQSITAPVRSGFSDLRSRLAGGTALTDKVKEFVKFALAYRLFFIGLVVFAGALIAIGIFFADVTDTKKNYEVTITNPDMALNLNSEEVAYNELSEVKGLLPLGHLEEQQYDVIVINTSGQSGVAASVAATLAENGYGITKISADETRIDKKTVIVCDPSLQAEALAISKILSGALLSTRTASSTSANKDITIFVGQDQVTE